MKRAKRVTFKALTQRATPLGKPAATWPVPPGMEDSELCVSGDGCHLLVVCEADDRAVVMIDGERVAEAEVVSVGAAPRLGKDFVFDTTEGDQCFAHVGERRWGPFEMVVPSGGEPPLFTIAEREVRKVRFSDVLIDGKVHKQLVLQQWTPAGWVLAKKTASGIVMTHARRKYGPFESVPYQVSWQEGELHYRVRQRGKVTLYVGKRAVFSGALTDYALKGAHLAVACGKRGRETVSLNGAVVLQCERANALHLTAEGKLLFSFTRESGNAGYYDGERIHEGYVGSEGPCVSPDGDAVWLNELKDDDGNWYPVIERGTEVLRLPANPDYEFLDDFCFLPDRRFLCTLRGDHDDVYVLIGDQAYGPLWSRSPLLSTEDGKHWAVLVSRGSGSKDVYALHDGAVVGPFPENDFLDGSTSLSAEGTLTFPLVRPKAKPVIHVHRLKPAKRQLL